MISTLVIAELPLEYQRNFLLLEELEQTQQGKIIRNDLKVENNIN